MAIVTIDDKHLTDIADAIRGKNNTVTGIKPADMATAINDIASGGGEVKYTQVVLTSMSYSKVGPFNLYDYVDDFDKVLGIVVRISTDYTNNLNTQTYLKGMKTWDNQLAKFGGNYSNIYVKAMQTDNTRVATTALSDSATPYSGFFGLALAEDGSLFVAYYNSGSNYQCISGPSTITTWSAAYARIELIYI